MAAFGWVFLWVPLLRAVNARGGGRRARRPSTFGTQSRMHIPGRQPVTIRSDNAVGVVVEDPQLPRIGAIRHLVDDDLRSWVGHAPPVGVGAPRQERRISGSTAVRTGDVGPKQHGRHT
ncbi:hypothetical protein GCM10017778_55280 [Streptomyces vinaceus]|nr:hypothetical protein GCM10017778_55280 [Streptomyces vinaceus]